jgi:acyl-CoA dehydrogenase
MVELKDKAKQQGLWNLFLPPAHSEHGGGLSNLDYAPLAECMGRVLWAPEIFNCHAPDTGNIETLLRFGTPLQKERWLKPLLSGEIRSAFAMTEPKVASSDATNIQCSIARNGDEYVINGHKWFTTGAMRDSCTLLLLMGQTNPHSPDRRKRQSILLVPKDSPGLTILRSVRTLGFREPPGGEPEILLKDVRVHVDNLLAGEGLGFEVAQARLGPGRVHHCMRLIGCAQRALELMCNRVRSRSTFGKELSRHQSVREKLSQSFCDVEQARLLTLRTADKMDRQGNVSARDLIAAIKIVAPSMAFRVIDRAIQLFGAAGLTDDYFLAEAFNYARETRIADGPDEVHMMTLGKHLAEIYGPNHS